MRIAKKVDGYNVEIDILSTFKKVIVKGKVYTLLRGDNYLSFEVTSDDSGRIDKSISVFGMRFVNRDADRFTESLKIANDEVNTLCGVISDLRDGSDAANIIMDELSYKDMMFNVNELIESEDAVDMVKGDFTYMYLMFAKRALYYVLLTPDINSSVDHKSINYPEANKKSPEIASELLGDYLVRSNSFDWILNSLRKFHESKEKFGREKGRKLQELAFSIVASIFKKSSYQMEHSDNEKSADDILRIIKIIDAVRSGASLKIDK